MMTHFPFEMSVGTENGSYVFDVLNQLLQFIPVTSDIS